MHGNTATSASKNMPPNILFANFPVNLIKALLSSPGAKHENSKKVYPANMNSSQRKDSTHRLKESTYDISLYN